MGPLETQQRAQIVAIARSLLPEPLGQGPTPWRHMGRSRGGVDCAGVLIFSFKTAQLMPQDFDSGFYPADFMLHSDEERFLEMIERFCVKIERPARDADVALFKVGRSRAHCAVVDQWPRVIHAVRRGGDVQYGDASQDELGARFVGLWTLKEWT